MKQFFVCVMASYVLIHLQQLNLETVRTVRFTFIYNI